MPEIKIDKIIRSRRKTIGLMVTQEAQLIVRVPYYVSQDFIQRVVREKQAWIIAKQRYFQEHQSSALRRDFVVGEEFLFLGDKYVLTPEPDLPKAVVFDGVLKISSMVLANTKEHLQHWYKAQAFNYIRQRVDYYAQSHGLVYKSIKVNEARTRWGSCGHTNMLNFTWRLIMAPVRVIDYVVVHELMHLKQKNHSRKFWNEVAKIIPDYRWDKRWLKDNGHLLAWNV